MYVSIFRVEVRWEIAHEGIRASSRVTTKEKKTIYLYLGTSFAEERRLQPPLRICGRVKNHSFRLQTTAQAALVAPGWKGMNGKVRHEGAPSGVDERSRRALECGSHQNHYKRPASGRGGVR